jgi:aspartate/methionine/tyrosine aminotransferase
MRLADRANIVDMGLDPEEMISFAGGWVAHRAPEELRREYRRLAGDPALFHELGAYSPTRGLPALRAALLRVDRALYRTPGLAEENLLVGQSSTGLTYALFVALLDPGDRVVLFDPAYANYAPQLALAQEGIEVRRLPVMDTGRWSWFEDEGAVLEGLARVLERESPTLLLLSAPDNPTGRVVPDGAFDQMVSMAEQIGCWVVVDYAYRAQCWLDEEPRLFAASPVARPNLIRVHSNSKWCRGLGRRLGWVEAAPEVVDALEVIQQSTALCPDTVHQYALANYLEGALDDGSLVGYLAAARARYRAAAEHLGACIDEHLGMRWLPPDGGLYTVVDVGRDGDDFAREALRATGVVLVPGSGFGPSLTDAVRVSFGPLVEDLPRIEEGISRLGRWVRGRSGDP